MVTFKVDKSILQGQIAIPPSKSHTLRAILFGALGKGRTSIRNYLPSTDAAAMIEACRLMGAQLTILPNNCLSIEGLDGVPTHFEDVIQAGNSGIVLRFITALAALSGNYTVVTGDYSIRHQRPVNMLLNALTELGAFAVSARGDGFAPIIVRGPLTGFRAQVDGRDSQPVSALLIAAALRDKPTEILVKDPGEKPWVDLTLDWLNRLGLPCEHEGYERYNLSGNGQILGFDYTVPADFSSAAFPIAAALLTDSELTLQNVDIEDIQGDKELIFVLQAMGAKIQIDKAAKTIRVERGGRMQGAEIDINNFIDAVPLMAVIACFAEGETRIVNAAVARGKECDRLQAIATELTKMGATVRELPDGLVIQPAQLKGVMVDSYHDHRMAMALTVAGLGAAGTTTINGTSCIAKTFPDFALNFQAIGAQLEVIA